MTHGGANSSVSAALVQVCVMSLGFLLHAADEPAIELKHGYSLASMIQERARMKIGI